MALFKVNFSDPFSVLGYLFYAAVLITVFIYVVKAIKKQWL
jgi:hypothetical protein